MGDTIIYKSKVVTIWFLRLLFGVLVSSFIYTLINDLEKSSYFLGVVLIFAPWIQVKSISIYSDRLILSRYYFFALFITRTEPVNVRILSNTGSLNTDSHTPEETLGCLLSIIAWLPIWKHLWLELTINNSRGQQELITVSLSEKECKMVQETFHLPVEPGEED